MRLKCPLEIMTADIRKKVLTNEQGQFTVTARFDSDDAKNGATTVEDPSMGGASDGVGHCIRKMVGRDSQNRMLTRLLTDEIKRMRGQRSKLTVKLESLRKNTVLATTELAAMETAMHQFLSLQKKARVRSIRDAESILENLRSTLGDEMNASRNKEELLSRLRIEYDLLDEQVWTLRQKVDQKPQKVNVVPVIKEIENNFEREVLRVLHLPSVKASSPIVFAKEIIALKDRYNTTDIEYKMYQEKLQFLAKELQNRLEQMSRRQQNRSLLEALPLILTSELDQLSRQRVYIQANVVKNANITDIVTYAGLLGPESIPRQCATLDVWARNLSEWALAEIDNGRQLIKQLKHATLSSLTSEGIKHRRDELHQLQSEIFILEHRLCELTEENERLWIQLNCELRHLPHERRKVVKTLTVEKKTVTVEKRPKIINSEKISTLTKRRAALIDSLNKSEPSKSRVRLIDHPRLIDSKQNICQLDADLKFQEQKALNATQKLRQLQHAVRNAVQESDICRDDLPHKEEINRRLFQRLQNAQKRMKEVKLDAVLQKERARFYLPVQASRLAKRIPLETEILLQDVLEEEPGHGLTFSEVMDSEYTKPPTECYETRATAPHTFSAPLQSARKNVSGHSSDRLSLKESRSAEEKSKEAVKTETETVETESVTEPRQRLMTVNVNCSDIRVSMMTQTLPALVRKKITRSTEIKTTEIEKSAEKLSTKSSSRSRRSSRGGTKEKSAALRSVPDKDRGRKKSNGEEEFETNVNVPNKKNKESKIN
uniref:Uncharacterized protein n=1 Tax=Romanomermis culicivorax TaxID=13658 RepID=A0A915JE00_ROMCU